MSLSSWVTVLLVCGVFRQVSPFITNLYREDDVTFECAADPHSMQIIWRVTTAGGTLTVCQVIRDTGHIPKSHKECGPRKVFSVAISDDRSQSTLTAHSVGDSLNGTTVVCMSGNIDQTIIIIACNPKDLRTPGVVWTEVPNDLDGQGSYSFPGGSVTYNGATATYMTTADYRVNGGRDLSTTCENEEWTPTAVITRAECVLEDLMPCNMSQITTDKTKMEICCTIHGKARSICAKYTGVSIGSKATFTTSNHFCTETGSTKTCTEGVAANLKEASTQEENRNEAVRSSGYVFPVSFVVSSGTLLGAVGLALKHTNKSRRGAVRLCFWMIVAFSVFFLGLFATLLVAFYSYTYSRTFSVRADVLRNSDSTCAAVTGSKGGRDGLLWSSFSSGTVAVFGVLSALVASRYARKRCDDDLPMTMLEPSDSEEKEPSPSTSPASPQPPLDPTEPEYNQPMKEGGGAPVVYADLNRPQKEKPLPTAGGGLEYASIVTGKLQPPHKETETDRPSTGDLEYAKLSHHKMKEEQGQCVEMEGPAEKASTSPTNSSEYGKLLDQLQVKEGSSEAGV